MQFWFKFYHTRGRRALGRICTHFWTQCHKNGRKQL